ncbi:PP2C family protein-serine/threonine phosphatase [Nakamurella antarctica]|uniref:PP2C family protein-serine/threonine phosphatase n=1 Tax=Nakamurella antarctica TaxID=1902245 RepID=UPI0019D1ED4C|nr:PP2C family serine/threonine-protein phosphatase [Nakamurella antarctica]
MNHTLRYVARTDRGLLRANNQDSVFAGDRLLVVADGMGGHVAGDTASRLAVAAFAPLDAVDPTGVDLLGPLEKAVHDGNNAISEMVLADPDLEGMGTTVTALLFDGKRLGVAHVGDSRAYLWRGGVLSQITHDDTFVQSLIDEGRITEDEASRHPQRSLLLRALNGGESEPTLQMREANVGDRYLVCSDGLCGVISAEAIADTLASYETIEAADRLIELALRGGGPDNVTVIVADVVDVGSEINDDSGISTGGIDPLDADATGPLGGIKFTRRMPRIALPQELSVSELAAQAAAARPGDAGAEPLPGSSGGPAGPDTDDGTDADLDADGDLESDPDRERDERDAQLAASELRASLMGPPPSRTRRWMRRAGFGLAMVVLLIVGAVLGIKWVGTRYFVADNAGQVTVFRGVDGSVLGAELSSAQENSCLGLGGDCVPIYTADLVPAARDQVIAGINASDLQDARAIVVRLNGQLLPLCPEPGAQALGSGATGTNTPSSTAASGSSGSTTPAVENPPVPSGLGFTPANEPGMTGTGNNSVPGPSAATDSESGSAANGSAGGDFGNTGGIIIGAGTAASAAAVTGASSTTPSDAATADAAGGAAGTTDFTTATTATTATTSTTATTATTVLTPTVSGSTISAPAAVPGVSCRVAR